MTDEPPPDRPQEHVQGDEEKTADAEAVYEALYETDSLDTTQLAANTGIDIARVDEALGRLQGDGRVDLTYLPDGTAIASRRKARG